MDKPNQLSEMDLLRLSLVKEKGARLEAEANALAMMRQRLAAGQAAFAAEKGELEKRLSEAYGLAPSDTISEDGLITRKAPLAAKAA